MDSILKQGGVDKSHQFIQFGFGQYRLNFILYLFLVYVFLLTEFFGLSFTELLILFSKFLKRNLIIIDKLVLVFNALF